MLELEHPFFQYEMGGRWTGRQVLNLRHGFDIREKQALLSNEIEERADYNAWWYMCMPLQLAREHGLPLPLFIKGDDMDYGLRAAKGIVLMNGIGIWHESFGKKYNGALEYYIKRNELLLNALHRPRYGPVRSLAKIFFACGKQVVFQRYNVVDFILRAYNDFLKGADFFLETDGESFNSELMAKNIPMLDVQALQAQIGHEFPGVKFSTKPQNRPHRLTRLVTLYSYLIPRALYPKKGRYRILELSRSDPVDYYMSQHVVQFNSQIDRGFISSLRKREAFYFGLRFLKLSVKMLFCYRIVARSYRKRQHELINPKFWARQFEIELSADDLQKMRDV